MGDHEALVAEFSKMDPKHVAQIAEAAQQVLMAMQPAGGSPSPSPMEPSAPPAGLAQSEVGDGGLDGGKPAGAASPAPGNTPASFPKTDNSGQSPMHPSGEGGNMHAKLASPSNLVPTSTFKSDPGPMNPGPETGKTSVPNSSMLGTTSQAPEGGLGGAARKSEADARIATLEKANQDLNLKLEQLIGLTTELVEKPIRKAITGLDYSPKPSQTPSKATPTSREEVTRRLNEKVRDPSLSKADRQTINDFYDGRVGLAKIEHLLK
jgi:hypothetical protein